MSAGGRLAGTRAAFDVGLHLARLLRKPLARCLGDEPGSVLEDLVAPPESWNDYLIAHVTRGVTWAMTSGICFVVGAVVTVVERSVAHRAGPISLGFEVAWGYCIVTAFVHGGAALFAARRSNRRSVADPAGPRRGLGRVLVWPGNRYAMVVALLFMCGALSVR